jgi:hypothetical protein
MNARRKLGLAVTSALAAFALAACGSGTDSADRATVLKELARNVLAQQTAQPQQPVGPAQVQAALEGSEGPLIYARFAETGSTVIMIGIEDNGPYTTYATQARQTITLRDGFLTASRGMGGDLMSVDIAGVRALIAARQAGRAKRVMRFLNAEDVTYEVVFDCRIVPGETRRVEVGAIATRATEVREDCTGRRGREITNTYMVDPQGRAVASRQWTGDQIGYTELRVLRF